MLNGSNALKLENNQYESYSVQPSSTKTLHRGHRWRIKQEYKLFYSILGNTVGLLLTLFSILFLVFAVGY